MAQGSSRIGSVLRFFQAIFSWQRFRWILTFGWIFVLVISSTKESVEKQDIGPIMKNIGLKIRDADKMIGIKTLELVNSKYSATLNPIYESSNILEKGWLRAKEFFRRGYFFIEVFSYLWTFYVFFALLKAFNDWRDQTSPSKNAIKAITVITLFVIFSQFFLYEPALMKGKKYDDLNTAENILNYLMKELNRRRMILVESGCVNIIKYNKKYPNNKLKYVVLVIDEFAFTSPRKYDDKDTKLQRQRLQGIVSDMAMMSRKMGIHLIIAMQRPSKELIPMEIKSNFPSAISFKMVNTHTSMTILGNTDAYYLPNIKGRMIFQLGSKQMELQAMLLEQEEAIKRLRMFDKLLDKNNVYASYFHKGDDIYVGEQFQIQEHEYKTKRLLPR